MTPKPVEVRPLDVKRFNALVGGSRSAALEFYGAELEWYANEDETIVGVVLRDLIDLDYVAVALARDDARRYRCFDLECSFPSVSDARAWLIRAIKWHTCQGVTTFPQGDEGKRLDLFTPVVPVDKQHVSFRDLAASEAFLPARSIIAELMPHFVDVDGTFVKEFQTKGFDARLWELYLHAYLMEEQLFIEREHPSPDFIVRKYGQTVAIEAVIVGRRTPYRTILLDEEPQPLPLEEIIKKNRDETPIQFGSALFTKLQKRYWELPHVSGFPLVFAIADFHDDRSMLWTSTGLMHYLYGVHHGFDYDEQGKLIITPYKIGVHQAGSKTIPSGYFFQPDAENVSAVLFSASGTISKFNRIGRQAGFRHPDVTMIRVGTCHNHDPNACVPHMFHYEVNEECDETWAEGLSMFHNPQARFPVPGELFPSIAHHRFVNGQIISQIPEFHPYASYTYHLRARKGV
jgi:hypothetical protein